MPPIRLKQEGTAKNGKAGTAGRSKKPPQKPKLVNRGAAGLLNRIPHSTTAGVLPETLPHSVEEGQCPECCKAQKVKRTGRVRFCPKHGVAPDLRGRTMPVDDLVPDPHNARVHPEKNLEAICASLLQFGQVKPIVVRKGTNVVMAGNGTLECAKKLGWERVAVSTVEMTDAEAAAYGLADNKTAELARWDFEQVARIDRLIVEEGMTPIGWSIDELEVLRLADWTPPEQTDDTFEHEGGKTLKLTAEEAEAFDRVVNAVRDQALADDEESPSEGECLLKLCELFEAQ